MWRGRYVFAVGLLYIVSVNCSSGCFTQQEWLCFKEEQKKKKPKKSQNLPKNKQKNTEQKNQWIKLLIISVDGNKDVLHK